MKVIDLLNKIANGEEPPEKIKVNKKFIYEYDGRDYKSEDGKYLCDSYIEITKEDMNIEVKIIEDTPKEDKKIEKLCTNDLYLTENQQRLVINKINEIIDKINGE
jgi:hypothetical protein